jgi:predicted small secreted protein
MRSTLRIACAAVLLAFPLVACDDDGPAERVGERIDRAGEQLRDSAQRTVREIERAVD